MVVLRREQSEAEGGPTPATEPETALDLAEALAAIPPRQRATIVLRYYCDLSVDETAAVLLCSPGTVKSQTWHGLAALRRQLTPDHASL